MNASEPSGNEAPPTYRVGRDTLKGDAPLLAILLADLVYGLLSLRALPARVPVHWGASGEVDGWGPPWMNALLPPAIAAGLYLLFLFVPLVDPRRKSYALFPDTLRFFRWLIVLGLVGLHVVLVRVSLGDAIRVDFVVRLGIGLLFAALGNRFGKLRQNFFFGIRVPWTIMNEEVWNRTHRMAGRLWVAGGLLLAAAAFLPPRPGIAAFVVVTVVLVAVPVLHSYVLYRRIAGE